MYSYKDIGLVNTKDMFKKAFDGHYAIPAYNFSNLEQLQAIIESCVETQSPVIMQISKSAYAYANKHLLRNMMRGAVEYAHELGCDIPICLHLDHGPNFEVAKDCIDNGFSSVMIDGSALPYDENVALTKQVCDYAHSLADYVTVEGELGVLGGVEDEVSAAESHYTKPEEVQDFVSKTGVDSLAISIGTSHGRCKFTPEQCTRTADGILVPPPLAFNVLSEIEQKLPGFPIVLHGASTIPVQYVKEIEQFGGKIPDSVGIPEEQLRKAAASAVCKINVDSDARLAMTAAVRKVLAEHPDEFDPRKYLGAARTYMKDMYCHKNKAVFGSAGHALD
ncbi:MAG: class II fructose-1,6-bisphosphate aldolase [Treponema sp.]|nr:class II fructose-1,6-bisphosphate aldolase [Treponema sp.]